MKLTARTPAEMSISVIGAGCRVPGAQSLGELWQLLIDEKCLIREEPLNRWAIDPFLRKGPKKAGYAYTFAGGYLDNPFLFDPAPFGLSPREAEQMDPQQRILLETVWRCFENAGLPVSKVRGKPVGVYVGASLVDYQSAASHDMHAIGSHFMTGNSLSILANRISYVFNFIGPSATYDAACASSFVALYHAVQALRAGEIDYAVVAGVNLMFSPLPFVGFCQAGMLSPSGQSRPFSDYANGYVRAEGCVALLLRRSQDAARDGHHILTDIIDIQTNSDGRKTGISLPSASGQTALINAIYEKNGLDPNDLQFVEAHGTGTPVGDPIEAHAIGSALGQKRTQPLIIGSIKSNLGHLEAASGLAGLLKASMALNHEILPATVNVEIANQRIPLDDLNLSIARDAVRLDPGKPALAGVCNYGFGGVNAHVILRRAQSNKVTAHTEPKPRPSFARNQADRYNETDGVHRQARHFLLLSAASELALRMRARQASAWIKEGGSGLELAALSGHGANHLSYRLTTPLSQDELLAERLEHFASTGSPQKSLIQSHLETSQLHQDARFAFIFSGNGSHYVSMGQLALEKNVAFRRSVERFDQAYSKHSRSSIVDLITRGLTAQELIDTRIVQPVICAIQIGLCDVLSSYGIKPNAVIGHSFGEIAAAYAAGILDLASLTQLIYQRSNSQHAVYGRGTMAVIAMGQAELTQFLKDHDFSNVTIAAINSERSTTISADHIHIQNLQTILVKKRIACVKLDIEYPFHSAVLDPYKGDFLKSLGQLPSHAQSAAFFSTVKGCEVHHGDLDATYWWDNIRQPVLFGPTLAQLIEHVRPTHLIEIGPKALLHSIIRSYLEEQGNSPSLIAALDEPAAQDQDPVSLFVAHILATLPDPFLHSHANEVFGEQSLDLSEGLPYPFDQSEFILPSHPYVELYGTVSENEASHPLLGRRLTQEALEWQNIIGPQNFGEFKDHGVNGATVLPAAGFIEICFHVLKKAFPEFSYQITTLDILRPCILDQDLRLLTRVTPRNSEIEISGKPVHSNHEPLIYVRAQYRRQTDIYLNSTPTLKKVTSDEDGLICFDCDEVYIAAKAMGLDYGPAFKLVTKGQRNKKRGHSELITSSEEPIYTINPMSIDAGFHALLLDLNEDAPRAETYLPIRFKNLTLFKECRPIASATSEVLARRRLTKAARLTYWDKEGQPVFNIGEAVFRHVDLAAPSSNEAFSYQWLPLMRRPLSEDAALRVTEGPYIAPTLKPQRARNFIELYRLLLLRIVASAMPDTLDAWTSRAGSLDYSILYKGRDLVANSPFASPLEMTHESQDKGQGDYYSLESLADLTEAQIVSLIVQEFPQAATDLQVAAAFKERLREYKTAIFTGDPEVQADKPASSHLGVILSTILSKVFCVAIRQFIDTLAPGKPLLLDCRDWPFDQDAMVDLLDKISDQDRAIHLALTQADYERHRHVAAAFNSVNSVPWAYLQIPAPWAHPIISTERDTLVDVKAIAVIDYDPVFAYLLNVMFKREISPSQLKKIISATRTPRRVFKKNSPIGTISVHATRESAGPVINLHPTSMPTALRVDLLDLSSILERAATSDREGAPLELLIVQAEHIDNHTLIDAALNLRELFEGLTSLKKPPHLIFLMRGGYELASHPKASQRALIGFCRVARNEYSTLTITTLDSELELNSEAAIHLSALGERELFVSSRWTVSVPRISKQADYAPLVECPTELRLARRSGLDSLTWIDADVVHPQPGEVLVRILSTSLNYRDVLVALGLFDDDLLGHGHSEGALGFEISGVVEAVGATVQKLKPGDRVVGFCQGGGFRSHIVCSEEDIFKLSSTLNVEAAGGSLVAYATAYYALVDKAQLQAGETVLIHGGAGAVGFAATQIAKGLGAKVVTTARDHERMSLSKWSGAELVLPSRDLKFCPALRDMGGVDVVLNSIAGEGMAASLEALKPFGRFIELGKRDFLEDTPLHLRPFLRNLTYHGVDLDELIKHRRPQLMRMMGVIFKRLSRGEYPQVPFTLYRGEASSVAFEALRHSEHFGKLAIRPSQSATPRSLLSPQSQKKIDFGDGLYIVVGGTRGLGFATALWLAERGVRHLILASRSGAMDEGDRARLDHWAQSGVDFTVEALDIEDLDALANRFVQWRERGIPIHGIIHSAVHLEDAIIQNLTQDSIERVFASKVTGARNLDRLSRGDPLKQFIVYTSSAGLVGNPGQAAYVAANAYLEGLMLQRRRCGLPALAIGWGAIADTGLLTRDTGLAERLEKVSGLRALPAKDALAWLDRLLACGPDLGPIQFYSSVKTSGFSDKLAYLQTPIFSRLRLENSERDRSSSELLAELMSLPREAAINLIVDVCRREIAQILKMPLDAIEPSSALSAYGFDSLMGLELLLSMEKLFGQTLPTMGLADKSIADLAQYVWDATHPEEASQGETGDVVLNSVEVEELGRPTPIAGGLGQPSMPTNSPAEAAE